MADLKNSIVEVKLAYNIVDYIQQSGVRLKKTGSAWKGLCPFHSEKSSSFTVSEDFQNYHCFGCSAHGDIISYVQATEHLEFFEALKKLAEDRNIELDIDTEGSSSVDYASLRECMREISNFFLAKYRALPNTHPARMEVKSRGLSEEKMLYGYAPEGRGVLYQYLKNQKFSDEVILESGACFKLEKEDKILDFWNGRLMFFITNSAGKSIGWSGRKLYENDTRGKYVNSKDSILFNKSESLYNIASAKKSASELNEMYVCEGQFDVGALIEAGASNVVASSGTAFTEKQAQIIRRLVGENGNIVFCFDADGAGIQAVERIFANIPIIHGQSFVVSMPEGKDPCDYRLENSNQELLELLTAHRKPLVEFILEQSAQKYNLDSHAESAQYVDKASQVLKTISNNTLRSKYIDVVALEAFISVDAVIENVAKASKMDSSGELTVETVPEVPRPELVEGDQLSEKIITMIKQDRVYGTSARLIALTLRDRSLLPELVAIQSKIPPHLDSIVKELEAISPTANLVAENFNLTKIVDSLTTPEYFPFTLDHELNCKLFKSLSLELDKYSHRRREVSARRKISKVLETSPKVSARYLRAALAAEERGLQKG